MPDQILPSPHRFLVALSFPGEKRVFVRAVAECLAVVLGRERVFYDEWYESELARANLDIYLQNIYGEQSALIVPFFDKNYDSKPWCCKVEWPAIRTALTFSSRNDDYLMAMRFDNAPIKGFLQIHGYIEIRDRLPEAIANIILQRLSQMGVLSDQSIGKHSMIDVLHNLPFQSIGGLLRGRDGEVTTLLREQRPAVIPQAIQGMGGVGKTRLAVELGWQSLHSGKFQAILFVRADSPAALQSNLAALALHPLKLLLREQAVNEQDVYERVIHHFESRDDWFLILDNVDTDEAAQAVQNLLPRLTRGRILITSRRRGWRPPIELTRLNALALPEATQYLLDATPDRIRIPGDDNDALTLAGYLGGLPLALEQAAAYINWQQGTFNEYQSDWDQRREKVLVWADGLAPSLLPVALTYERTVAVLSPAAKALLRLSAFLSNEPIPMFMLEDADVRLTEAIGLIGAENTIPQSEKPEISQSRDNALRQPQSAMHELAHFSLIDRDPTAFTVHPMIQEAVRYCIPEKSRRQWLECALNWVNDHAPADARDVRTWNIWDPLRSHAEAIARTADLVGITKPTSRLMNCLGLLLLAKANYDLSEPLFRRALAIDEIAYGSDHAVVAYHLNNLAALLQDTNRLAAAEPLYRRALIIDEAIYGSDHPNVARDLNNLAQLLHDTNRLSEAEPLMQRVLTINEMFFGSNHSEVALALNNLAQLLQEMYQLDKAEPLMRRALFIDEATYGPHHPTVARDLNNLASLLQATNNLSEAESLFRRAITINEASYGADHLIVATDYNNLARLLKVMNRLAEAEPFYRQALAIWQNYLGNDHPNVAIALSNLASLLHDTNRSDEAEPLMIRALSISEQSHGKNHPNVASALNNLALLLQDTNRLAEAEPLMRRVVNIFEKSYGQNHPSVATALNNLARLLKTMNRLDEAEPLHRRALNIDEKACGPMHPSTAVQLGNLGYFLMKKGELDEAEQKLRCALEVFETCFTDPNNPYVLETLQRLKELESRKASDAKERASS